MSRNKKIILGVVGAVVAVIVVALVAVSVLVNPNDYKDRIASAAESALGRKVQLEGDLSLSVFPWVEITTGAVRVENPAEFGGGDFVSLKEAALSLDFMPLLTGSVRIDKVTATDMTVLLVKDKNGRANWEFGSAADTAPAGETPAGETPAPESAAPASDAGAGLDIAISSLELVNADITYRDLASGASYQVKQFNFSGDNLAPGEEFKLAASGLIVAVKEALNVDFTLDTTGSVDPQTMSGSLTSINLKAEAQGQSLPGGKASLALSGEAEMPKDRRQTRVHISSLEAEGFDGKLSFNGAVSPLEMSGSGEISLSLSIKKALAALGSPVQTQNPEALEKFELHSQVELSPAKGIALPDLQGKLDSTAFTGNLAVNPGAMAGGKGGPSINSNLEVSAINVDDYLPPKGAAKAEGAAGAGKSEAGQAKADAAPPAALKTLNGKITFAVEEITAAKAVISKLSGVLVIKNGEFILDPCIFGLFSGQITAKAKANMAKAPMPLALDVHVKNMALGEVMQFLSGEQKITGNTNATLSVTGAGSAWPAISKTLAGSGAVDVRDGVISQIKLVPDSASSLGIAGVAPLKPLDGKLQSLTATFKGNNGRFTNNDLNMISSIANITGAGWVDLGQNTIGYELMVGGSDGYHIPVVVSGSLSSPSTGIDGEKFMKANAGQLLNDVQGVGDAVTDPAGTAKGALDALGVGGGEKSSGGGSGSGGKDSGGSITDKVKDLF